MLFSLFPAYDAAMKIAKMSCKFPKEKGRRDSDDLSVMMESHSV
jgi:hypothetical protein